MTTRARQACIAALIGLATGAASAAGPDCSDYAARLSAMTRADQALRSRWDLGATGAASEPPRIVQQTLLVDRRNADELGRWLRACGWPRRSVHGDSAVNDAWLVVQHADHDRAFQRRALVLLEAAVKAGEAPGGQLAYLSDRVAIGSGQPQRYGTQLEVKGPCDVAFAPMDDRAAVEVRRRAVGLPPLEDYRRVVIEQALGPQCRSEAR